MVSVHNNQVDHDQERIDNQLTLLEVKYRKCQWYAKWNEMIQFNQIDSEQVTQPRMDQV